ncbi:hypothetical protein EJ04DRAFT_569426 [Polyplosphaeria fusca]|uniref:DUF7924 domain-containing protein n=1 Tax=Polyplosphaeria fusca TaxID=682080 RepID=A0A9P4QL90_9PLEO|nr:hypothetical protein EJ04DRAFT_569426 [Polyplosphaeria fusca]
MARGSSPLVNQRKRRSQTLVKKENSSHRRRSQRLKDISLGLTALDTVQQAKAPKRAREEDEPPPTRAKRTRVFETSLADRLGLNTIARSRVECWRENKPWPTEEQEQEMDRFRIIQHALPKKRSGSLRRKRSDASINTDMTVTATPSDQQPRERKSAPYKQPRYETQLKECGSFMGKFVEGIIAESRELCQKLLYTEQPPPEDTLFDEQLFETVLESVKGRNETRVLRDISPLLVPSAEVLAIRGAKHLDILRETTNAGWNDAIPFLGPRPQPDYGLGFKREAFSQDQLLNLRPFIGDESEDCSYVAATYDMYFPCFTCEVKCGASALDVADRQNAHSQTVALQNLVVLFRLVGREKELHRAINGFSISHSDVDVRIWGHYAVIDEEYTKYYRHPIGEFSINNTELDRGKRWTAYTFVRNLYDIWIPAHFERICSVIDMLPPRLDFAPLQQLHDRRRSSSRLGLSQQLEYSSVEDGATVDNESYVRGSTPDTTVQTESGGSQRKRAK